MFSLPPPTHDYIGPKLCGCVVAVVADLPSAPKQTARMIAACIRDGLCVERVPFADLAAYFPLGCRCPKSEQLQLLAVL